MYKDEIWYRKLEKAIEEHKTNFSKEQVKKYQINVLLRLAKRVADFSETCETCRGFQHPITRLEEEMQELPDSKAQRQYQQEMIQRFAKHFREAHNLFLPGYYTSTGLTRGAALGLIVGAALGLFIFDGLPYMLYAAVGLIVGLGVGFSVGSVLDAKVKRNRRLV